ncbi:MAG: ABC transporter permease [Chlorobi bacterium]|nr:ABC transporter permease [Chlorobiota bacterium]
MKSFRAFVIKEFKHIFRDVRTLVILFGMPIVLVVLFGFAITTEINNAKIAVLDLAHDNYSHRLLDKISSSGYFNIADDLQSYSEIEKSFSQGDIKLAVVIGENFGKKMINEKDADIQIITDASDPNTANIVSGYLTAVIQAFTLETGVVKPPKVTVKSQMLYNPENKSVFMFVPGVMTIILMLVSAMMTSITIAKEKELGTMEILLVSPLKPYVIIIGKIIPYLFLSLINAITILLLGLFVFQIPMHGDYLLLLSEVFLFIVSSLILGLLISAISDTQQAAMLISMLGLMLPTILLSGFIFPISSMPEILQYLSDTLPAKWFIIIIKSIMLKGAGIKVIAFETAFIAIITLILGILTVKKFKIRLE